MHARVVVLVAVAGALCTPRHAAAAPLHARARALDEVDPFPVVSADPFPITQDPFPVHNVPFLAANSETKCAANPCVNGGTCWLKSLADQVRAVLAACPPCYRRRRDCRRPPRRDCAFEYARATGCPPAHPPGRCVDSRSGSVRARPATQVSANPPARVHRRRGRGRWFVCCMRTTAVRAARVQCCARCLIA